MLEEKFEERLRMTKAAEETIQAVTDSGLATNIRHAEQEVNIDGLGVIVFRYPNVKLSLEGDREYARFLAKNLRSSEILTRAQLKAIYGMPVKVEVDGKEVVVGEASWSDKDESSLESIPEDIKKLNAEFVLLREEIRDREEAISKLKPNAKKKKKMLNDLLIGDLQRAEKAFNDIALLNLELIELQTQHLFLFSSCLEEMANMEKIKLYAPSCIFKRVEEELEHLWKSEQEFEEGEGNSIRVLSLYNIFLRGGDVSFFADSQEAAET